MRPILVLLLVIAGIGILLLGLYSLLGNDSATPGGVGPGGVEEPAANPRRGPSELSGPELGKRDEVAVPPPPQEARTTPNRQAQTSAGFANQLTGLVLTPEGEPLAGAQVTLSTHGTDGIVFVDDPVDPGKDLVTRTDAQGRYAFKSLTPRDHYNLIADHAKYARTKMLSNRVLEEGTSEEPPLRMQYGARLIGYVSDTSGNRVPDTTLHLDGMFLLPGGETADRMTARSNNEGFYEFANVPQGNEMRTLNATAPGYASQTRQSLMFGPDKPEMTIDIVLQPALMLSGRVIAPTGMGLDGVRVMAIGTAQGGGRSTQMTKDGGRFLFEDLSPGKYMVQAAKAGYRYKEMPRADAGGPEVIIEMLEEGKVTGCVVDADTNEPVAPATMRLRFHYQDDLPTAPSEITATTDERGCYTLAGVQASAQSKYVVEAVADGYAPTFSTPFPVGQSQIVTGIDVRMTRGGTIVGQVVDHEGHPVANARVRTEDNEFVDDMFQRALGASFPTNATSRETRSNAEGRFEIKNLHAATYQVIASAPGYTELSLRDLVVAENGQKDLGAVRLNRGGTLRGTLYDGAGTPVVAGHVTLEPTTAGGDGPFQTYETKSGASGKYEIGNILPGIYRLMATRSATNTGNPLEVLLDAKNSERQVTIGENETVTQDLTLVE